MGRAWTWVALLTTACSGAERAPLPSADRASEAVEPETVPMDVVVEAAAPEIAEPSDSIVRPLLGHRSSVTAVALSADGRWLASGAEDGTILLWDLASAAVAAELAEHRARVSGLAFSPSGERLISTSLDRTTREWAVPDGQVVRVLQEGVYNWGATFSPDGSMLVTGGSDGGSAAVWDAATGDTIGTVRFRGVRGEGAFLADGTLLMRDEYGVLAWNVQTRRAVGQIRGPRGGSSLAIHPDGALLALETRTHVALVDVPGRRVVDSLATPPGAGRLAFTSAGELLMAAGRTIHVWDVRTDRELASISGVMGDVTDLAVSSDGSLLVAGSRDGAVWLWDLPGARRAFGLGAIPRSREGDPPRRGVGIDCDRLYGDGSVVMGLVLDSIANAPVDSVEISINGCRVHTDADGSFLIVGVDRGTHLLEAYKGGWTGGFARIQSVVGDTSRITFRVAEKPTCNPADHPEPPRVESRGAVVTLRLHGVPQAVLDSVAPGFVPYRLDAYRGHIGSMYELTCYQAPSAVVGDFNGDGIGDLAAMGTSGNQEVSLVLISSGDTYQIAALGRRDVIEANGSAYNYYARVEPGVIRSPWEDEPLELTTHAVLRIADETASAVSYWRDGEWLQYTTGD